MQMTVVRACVMTGIPRMVVVAVMGRCRRPRRVGMSVMHHVGMGIARELLVMLIGRLSDSG